MKKLAIFLAVCLLLAVSAPFEVPFALLFGWVPFLLRVLPRITVEWAGVGVSGLALLLFIIGVHWAGRAWHRSTAAQETASLTWKVRSSLGIVTGIGLLFAAGIALVGITHQVVWLLNADEPLVGSALKTPWSTRSVNNLKSIGLAMHNYDGSCGSLPRGGTFGPDGAMLHSWETYLLPYLSYMSSEIDLTCAWNHPRNAQYFKSVLPVFINPEFRTADFADGEGYGLSHYAANSRILAGNKTMRLSEITANPATLLLAGEVNTHFQPWGYPVNWRDPVRGINRSPDGFGGPKGANGANFIMADGSVRFVSERISPVVLRTLSSPDRGEEVDGSVLGQAR